MFSAGIWKIVAGIAGVGAIGFLLTWLWHPENWSPLAKAHYQHEARLVGDSLRWHTDSLGMRREIVHKDSLIGVFRAQWQEAKNYGQQWKSYYQEAIVQKDALTDALTDRQRELAYYRALQKNGTLSPLLLPDSLKADRADVIRAGLKTAGREETGRRVIDTLSRALGIMQAGNARLKKGLQATGRGLESLSANVRLYKHGGIWPFNHKRRKQLKSIAGSLDSLRVEVERQSDLEIELNKP